MFGISSGTICGTKPVRKAPPFRDLYSFAPIDLETHRRRPGGGGTSTILWYAFARWNEPHPRSEIMNVSFVRGVDSTGRILWMRGPLSR